jgi:hypothetical protein
MDGCEETGRIIGAALAFLQTNLESKFGSSHGPAQPSDD